MSERIDERPMDDDQSGFNARAVLDLAHSGNAPQSWHVYRANKLFIVLQLVAPVCWIVWPFVVVFGSGPGLISSRWMLLLSSGDLGLIISTGCQLAIILTLIPLAIWLLVLQVRELRTVDRQLLVVTPDGFVEKGGRYGALVVSFADSRYIPLRSTYGPRDKRALLLPDEHGQLVEWHPDPQFRPAGQIVEQILAAYAAYTTEHAGAR